ncbi:MAG: 4-(cytidine 5'-diphospho)-2-C-methyl-D-erythritol kinase [Parvibaculum sp.]|uniref:4-(cytidine 5'-diphospho)-2-C-methyl-D-erythritol kinase n=1 Tax=Parvibaculum sp. TaxID=2024848 RepID=UPI0025D5823E|nr:4-(cytidine 5'-diphospho)-2-C-methyl-D-erythritol kinase [Parvibaculum sp.]MCE9649954.1 4-(cytidine 5'-diphospho)-2-C-methyl-D-erythritol kinase [Parvibaculum sp.]
MPAREDAPAKINLSLKVLGRRPDRYHELQSLVVFAACGDVLTGEPADALSLDVAGPFAGALAGEGDNLVLQAAKLLGDYLGIEPKAHLRLEKNLPVASGIGGGSADAAAAFRLLKKLWNADTDPSALASLALCVGADVPVCLDVAPALMWGKGELIARTDALPPFWLVLANPGVALSTAEVFGALAAPDLAEKCAGPILPAMRSFDDLTAWLADNGNDLEAPARKLAPAIADVLEALKATKDCRLARMSGSGATCFGMFADEVSARAAEAALKKARPGWWVAAAKRL